MPSLETAGFQSTISDSTIIGASTVTQWSTGSRTHSTTSTGYIYSYATSKIVRAAVAAGVIVLCLAAIISSGIRLRQRLRRQRLLALSLRSEQQANAYEVAAWADEPSSVPVRGMSSRVQNKKNRKERKDEMRTWKREGANAYALHEWEGIAS
nr:hypothetical protein L204_03145 [Cryptococcus depauperatus CBS 7855]